MILNLEGNNKPLRASSGWGGLSRLLSPVYNTQHVIGNRPIAEDVRAELKFRLLNASHMDRSSDKTKSLLNVLSKSFQPESFVKPASSHKHRGLISKIYQNQKNLKFHLFKYNAVKDESADLVLDSFFVNRTPVKKFAMGKNSGYYFIYDNQGTISVICEHVKICELTLPDSRMDPTLLAQELDFNKFLLFVAGGFSMRGSNSSTPLDSIAVFFLNFQDASRVLTSEPLTYIKMKYARMHPILLTHKTEKQRMLIVLGGNVRNKFKEERRKKNLDKKKSSVGMFNEGNMMCETIGVEKVWNAIHQAHGENVPVISTDDCLCLIINGREDPPNDAKTNSIRYYLGDAAILQVRDRKKHKIAFIFGVGKEKHEVWYIDLFDFVEHKAYIYQSQSFLRKDKTRTLCNAMLTKIGEEVCYLDHDETTRYHKIPIKRLKHSLALSVCNIF